MNPCFENAIDSLEVGIEFYTEKKTKHPIKHAILAVYHAVELLLKARLYKENFLFVFRKPEKPIKDDSQTVGLEEALGLLANLGVELEPKMLADLRSLKRRRNRIEHFEYRDLDEDELILGKALRFLTFFLENHLEENLADYLGNSQYQAVMDLIFSYEERLEIAAESMLNVLPADPSELSIAEDPSWCPACGNQTVLVEDGEYPFCHFCKENQNLLRCQNCQELVPSYDFADEVELCHSCIASKLG